MRRVLVMVVSLALGSCAFEPQGQGGGSVGDDDQVTETDAETDPSTVADARLPLPDASLPLPDAAPPPIDAAPPTENACSNGDDDDRDGATDCRDDDCPSCGFLGSCCASGACALLCL